MSNVEAWLSGPVEGIAPVLQPTAHALIQAREEIAAHAASASTDDLWRPRGAGATAGFHALHLAGALDRLFTYARGEMLSDAQKAAAKAEAVPHPELDGDGAGHDCARSRRTCACAVTRHRSGHFARLPRRWPRATSVNRSRVSLSRRRAQRATRGAVHYCTQVGSNQKRVGQKSKCAPCLLTFDLRDSV